MNPQVASGVNDISSRWLIRDWWVVGLIAPSMRTTETVLRTWSCVAFNSPRCRATGVPAALITTGEAAGLA